MATDSYEVLATELTLHRAVGEVRDPVSADLIDIQQGRGRTVTAGTIVSANEISPIVLDALENEDHPSHEYVSRQLRAVSDDPNEDSLGEPIAGYDEMELGDILAAIAALPSVQVQRIKEYEALNEGREEIVTFNIGYGESPIARQTGLVSSEHEETDDTKDVARIRTRANPPPDDEVVAPGEGITGTGEPAIEPGTAAREADEDGKKKVVRRGRRVRASDDDKSSDSSSGSGSSGE